MPAFALPARPVADWATVGQRIARSREEAKLAVDVAAARADISIDDLQRQEAGEATLDSFDLDALAGALGTTTGAWFYGDEHAMFRGGGERDVAAEAEKLGLALMSQYLAVEATCR